MEAGKFRDNENKVTRRDFIVAAAAGAGAVATGSSLFAQAKAATAQAKSNADTGHEKAKAGAMRPNILWIVSEDNNPHLGCYGNKLVRTPTLDGLARQGVLYQNCFSQAPVCAPSRFTLITGMYATSCGPAEHMRAEGKIPPLLRGFPAYLREAGYYCTNNDKTDYNAPIKIEDAWDDCSKTAHWRSRPPGKPFFAVFNFGITHESQVFLSAQAKMKPVVHPVDPAKVDLPAYHPDTPEFRRDREIITTSCPASTIRWRPC